MIVVLFLILTPISAEIYRQRRGRKGEAHKIHLGVLMALWTFEVKFTYVT
jgi:hypothetical protein